MKRNFTLFSKISLLLLSVVLAFSACTEEKYYPVVAPEGDFAVVLHKDAEILASQWNWNSDESRYVATVAYPELQKDEYEYGIVVGNVYINEGGVEKQYPLPYVRTYIDDYNNLYTETISCALSYDRKNVEFYIESSDKERDDNYLGNYYFKVDIIMNFTYQ